MTLLDLTSPDTLHTSLSRFVKLFLVKNKVLKIVNLLVQRLL